MTTVLTENETLSEVNVQDPPLDVSGLNWTKDFSELTQDDLIERAKQVAPLLIPLQEGVEKRRHYSREVYELFKKAGFYRTLVPRMYGGFEFEFTTYMRIVSELCVGCSSTAWQFSLGSSHTLQFGTFLPKELQDEVFASPDFIAPGTVKPAGQAKVLPNGDLAISGKFSYGSGVPFGSHFLGSAIQPDEGGKPVAFLAPREYWTQLDDWGQTLGLKGSGSHSIQFDNAVLPARYILHDFSFRPLTSQDTHGFRLHGNPMYANSASSVALVSLMPLAVGMARNAQKTFEELMEKDTTFPPIMPRVEDPFYQSWYGDAVGKVVCAEALMIAAGDQWMENCRIGNIGPEAEMRLVAMMRETTNLCWTAVSEVFFRAAGTSALVDGSRMTRLWRDMSTYYSHNGVVFFPEVAKRGLAQAHFGVAPA